MVCTDIVTFPRSTDLHRGQLVPVQLCSMTFFKFQCSRKVISGADFDLIAVYWTNTWRWGRKFIICPRGIQGQLPQLWHSLLSLTWKNVRGSQKCIETCFTDWKKHVSPLTAPPAVLEAFLLATTQFDGYHYRWPDFRDHRLTQDLKIRYHWLRRVWQATRSFFPQL